MSMICYMFDFPDAQLDQLLASPETIDSLIEEESEFATCFDKAWHFLHFLLNGEPWSGREPVSYLVCGGQNVGEIDVGYGPARVVKSEQVAAFHDAVEQVSEEQLRQGFYSDKFQTADLYPSLGDNLEKEFDYLIFYFNRLKEFLADAKRNGVGMVVYLS